jgi:hypothetical protein
MAGKFATDNAIGQIFWLRYPSTGSVVSEQRRWLDDMLEHRVKILTAEPQFGGYLGFF